MRRPFNSDGHSGRLGSFRFLARVVPALAALFAGACASMPGSYTLPPTLELENVPPDQAWESVLAVVRDRGWTIEHSDRDGGLVVTEWLTAHDPNRWMDCGNAGLLKQDVVHGGTVTFALRPVAGGTAVDVSANWSVRRQGLDDVVRPERCASRGALERSLYDDLLPR